MASSPKNPLQAAKGSEANALGPLESVELARQSNETNTGMGIERAIDAVSSLDPMWEHAKIDGVRWNKAYPYQLILLEKTDTGYRRGSAQFTLPIPPQAISISTPFAISTTVTLGGIVEEHNGAPLKTITFSGTTGVHPLKGTGETLKQAGVVQSILAGTITAISNTVSAINADTANNRPNLVSDSNLDELKGTGYYQFHLLQIFLERYASLKRTENGRDVRLAVAMWKDQAIYLVTPVTFDVRRDASSPWEYQYNLVFRAWRRITHLGQGPDAMSAFKPISRDPNQFTELLNKMQDARRVLQGARDALLAINADAEKVLLEPIREVVLFAKDAMGVATTAADLPSAITSTFKTALLESKAALARIGDAGHSLRSLADESGKSETGAGTQSSSGALSGADPGNKLFDNPEDNFALFEKIRPSDLSLPLATLRKINEEKRRIRKLTRLDFEKTRDQFVDFSTTFADAVGAGSPAFDDTYGRSATASTRTPTPDDFDVMFSLNEICIQMDKLAATSDVNRERTTTMETVAGMASASGIAFTVPTSKFAVPFPYGATLEQLAAQYLGDPDRWHEIVALNGLRQPYVDEEGFDRPLLVNGRGNLLVVSDATDLYISQPVWISSTTTSRTKRHIVAIDRGVPGQVTLTLDGDQDLDRFDVVAGAVLHAFKPDTVNSQMLIYIPSDEPADEESYNTKSIPGVDQFDPLIEAGGVDLLLTQNGDLAITPDGDCRLATGLTNLIQRIRSAMATPRGSLLHHPEYGLGLEVGVSTADLNAKQMLAALQGMVAGDPAFSGISGVAISKVGPVARVAMSVGVTGTNQTIPISVDIRR